MISYRQYRALYPDEQAQVLWQEGVYLELIRYTRKSLVELYALHDFYVEIFYDRLTEEPSSLKCFKQLKGLDPYLPQVPIDNIISIIK
jgi:hypothetical protein